MTAVGVGLVEVGSVGVLEGAAIGFALLMSGLVGLMRCFVKNATARFKLVYVASSFIKF